MELVVPVVSLTGADGRLDVDATRDYARAFTQWSPDATVLLCGSTGRGDSLPAPVREQVFAVWADVLPAERLLCCAWGAVEAATLVGRGHRVLLAMPAPVGPMPVTELAALIGGLGGAVYLYSHPRFGWQITAGILTELRGHGAEPTGMKLSKCSLGELAACRRAGSAGLTLWDGTARHVRASVAAGADGVVAACLAALPGNGPVGPDGIQRLADPMLRALDALPDRARRLGWLAAQVRNRLRAREIRCSG